MNGIWKHIMTAGLLAVVLPMSALAVTDEEIAKMNAAMPTKPVVAPQRPRTMLVFSFSQGFKHSSIPYWAKALEIMAEKTGAFKVVHSEDKSVFAPDTLAQFDAICFNNTTGLTFTDAQKTALMAFVKGGKGIVGIHAASDNFPGWPEASHMIGGVFQGHPWGAGGTWAIKIDDPEHPLMKPFAGKGFKVNDEIYRTNLPYYSRDKQRVLMSLDMSDEATRTARGVTPEDMDTGISWIKPFEKGRVFYGSLGHNHHLTWTTPLLEHYLAGIQYAMGDLKVDDAPLDASSANADTAAVQTLIEKIKEYDWGQNRASLTELQAIITRSYGSPESLKQIETLMQPLLARDVKPAALDFACRELSVFGTAISVPALAALLDSPETEHMARYALERIPDTAADKALLDKLGQSKNDTTRIGIVSSLGVRRYNGAVGAVSRIAADENKSVAQSAVRTLGMIGSPEAAAALQELQKSLASDMQTDALESRIMCADRLAGDGKTAEAQTLYESLYSSQIPAPVRIAALTGIARTNVQQLNRLLPTAIESQDPAFQAGAIRLVAQVKDASVLETILSKANQLSDNARAQLLAAMASNGSPTGRKAALTALSDKNADVRIAAYRLLGVVGDGSSVMPLAEAAAKVADRGEKDAARQALYRLKGQGITTAVEQGIRQTTGPNRNEEVAVELIRAVGERGIVSANAILLAAARDSSSRVAQESLRVLQTAVSGTDMPVITELLAEKPSTAMENVVVAAAEKIPDKNNRAAALLSRFDKLDSTEAKVSFLRVMGRLGDVNSLDTIRRMWRASEDKAVSDAAFRAMADWPGSDFLDVMKQLATGNSDETQKVLAFRAYLRMLSTGDGKTPDQSVEALAEAMKMTDRPQEQRLVLSAVGAYGTPKALQLAQTALNNPELKSEAQVAVVSICEKLMESEPDTAMEAISAVLSQTDNQRLQQQARRITRRFDNRVGYIVAWKIAGPYTMTDKNGEALFDVAFAPETGDTGVQWQPMPISNVPDKPWLVNIGQVFEGTDRVAYVRTVIQSPRDADAVFEIGSDDGVKVWLNGKLVHANNAARAVVQADDKVPVKMIQGENTILMKITQGSSDWGFCLKVTNPDGSPMRGLTVKQ